MDAIYSRPWSRHNNTKGETRRAVKKHVHQSQKILMILKEHLSVFFAVTFHEFWERHLVFIFFFPRYFAFVILVVVVFFLLHFSFFLLAGPNFELYIFFFQWYHIYSECPFISNNLNRIHSHLKWPIMSNSECATSQISGLSDPFGARSIHEILSCSLKRSRETISELGKFHHGFASPGMVNFMGEKWENIDERKGEKLGKRWWKTWETLSIWKKHWKTWGKFWETTNVFPMIFPVLCQYRKLL